jgi:Kdo2-lipid IVA lauroyltransferase/acyltransferase
LVHWLFHRCAGLPLRVLHAAGALLGWLSYGLSGTYRARFKSNLAQAGVPGSVLRAAVAHSGKTIAELPRLWLGEPVPVAWDGADLIDAVHASGKGLLLLTPHLGCFEVTAQAYAQRYLSESRPITVLYRPARKLWLQSIVAQSRNRPGLRSAPTTLAGVKTMMKALKAGETVGLLPDQVPPEGLGVWAPFFGRDAYTMTLPIRLAQQTQATVLLIWGERLPQGRGYCVRVRPLPSPLSADIATAAAQLNDAMAQVIRQLPAQYLWGYARYKQPAAAMHSSAGAAANTTATSAAPASAPAANAAEPR